MGYTLNLTFANTGLEYPEIQHFVYEYKEWLKNKYKILINLSVIYPKIKFKEIINIYGYPVISKEAAHIIYYARKNSQWAINIMNGVNNDGTYSSYKQMFIKYKYLLDSPFPISSNCCYYMKKQPFQKFQKETGLKPIIGTMAEESKIRKNAYLKNGCNSFQGEKSQPISFWKKQDILAYIYYFQIPFCSVYGDIIKIKDKFYTTKLDRTGCMFCMFGVHREKSPNRFEQMKNTHPKQYKYCMEQLQLNNVLDFIGVKY